MPSNPHPAVPGPLTATDPLAERIRAHVDALCGLGGDRHPGTQRNRDATAYVTQAMRDLGLETEELAFDVPEWRYGAAIVQADGEQPLTAHPGPFSARCEASGPLLEVSRAEQLEGLDARGAVLLLHEEIAKVQFTPRGYPWYSDPAHAAILDALEAAGPLAVLAATGKNPAMTAALSPFPLIEDPTFAVPSAYVTAEQGQALLTHVGKTVGVSIDSEVRASTGVQPVGRLAGSGAGRAIVAGHVDTKPETPGALDNAAGVATILAVAELLASAAPLGRSVEIVPFNGEDHVLSAGEVAYLRANPGLNDVALMVNVDDAGLIGSPTACSMYGLDERLDGVVRRELTASPSVIEGPQWPASDHMIFAMRGVPCIALITKDAERVAAEIAHTVADTPDLVDERLLAQAARFIAAVLAEV